MWPAADPAQRHEMAGSIDDGHVWGQQPDGFTVADNTQYALSVRGETGDEPCLVTVDRTAPGSPAAESAVYLGGDQWGPRRVHVHRKRGRGYREPLLPDPARRGSGRVEVPESGGEHRRARGVRVQPGNTGRDGTASAFKVKSRFAGTVAYEYWFETWNSEPTPKVDATESRVQIGVRGGPQRRRMLLLYPHPGHLSCRGRPQPGRPRLHINPTCRSR
jgi:hypothetical protein